MVRLVVDKDPFNNFIDLDFIAVRIYENKYGTIAEFKSKNGSYLGINLSLYGYKYIHKLTNPSMYFYDERIVNGDNLQELSKEATVIVISDNTDSENRYYQKMVIYDHDSRHDIWDISRSSQYMKFKMYTRKDYEEDNSPIYFVDNRMSRPKYEDL